MLDTNHLSRLLARDPHVTARLAELGRAQIATCVIARGELMFMAAKSERRASNEQRIEALLHSMPVHSVDEAAADWYGTLKAALINRFGPKEKARRRRTTIATIGVSENDLWIAAIAKRHALTVVSVDDDFRRIQEVTDLRLESWLPPGV